MEDISNRHLDFATFEAQSIKDDRNRAKAHGKSCYHWVKERATKEVEDTHGHWDRQDIVDKGPKEVLFYRCDRRLYGSWVAVVEPSDRELGRNDS